MADLYFERKIERKRKQTSKKITFKSERDGKSKQNVAVFLPISFGKHNRQEKCCRNKFSGGLDKIG